MSKDKRPKRDVHGYDENGMIVCNHRDREAANKAKATYDLAEVTCKKCLAKMYRTRRERR